MLPFLIFLVLRLGGNALIYGIMGATYSVFQLIGAPILGGWSDKYGRRKILLLSQAGTLVSWFIFIAALYLPVTSLFEVNSTVLGQFSLTIPLLILFLARAIDGITGGNVSVANAYLSDISTEENRNENFGKMSVAANLGFILGPAIAGLLGAYDNGETLSVIVAIIISTAALLLIKFNLPESNPCAIKVLNNGVRKVFGQEHKDCFDQVDSEKISFSKVLKLKDIPNILLIYFLTFLGFNLFYIAFPVYAVEVLKWELTDTGIFFAILGISMATVQGPVLKKVSKIYKDTTLILWGSLVLGISFLFMLNQSLTFIYISAVLLSIGNGVMWPSILSLLSRSAGEKYQGTVQGFAGSSGSVASIIGLVVGGILFNVLGSNIFILSSVLILAIFFMSLKFVNFNIGKPAVQN